MEKWQRRERKRAKEAEKKRRQKEAKAIKRSNPPGKAFRRTLWSIYGNQAPVEATPSRILRRIDGN